MKDKLCEVSPAVSEEQPDNKFRYKVDIEKLTTLCTSQSGGFNSYRRDASHCFDENKDMWTIIQNSTISEKDKERVEAICNYLRQITKAHSELQSFWT